MNRTALFSLSLILGGVMLNVALPTAVKSVEIGLSDRTHSLGNLTPEPILLSTLKGHRQPITAVAISADGNLLASGSTDDSIRIWDLKTGKGIRTLKDHRDTITAIGIHPEGKILISGSQDQKIKLWNLKTGRLITTINTNSPIHSIAISPQGSTFATGSDDGIVQLWRLQTGDPLRQLESGKGRQASVIFSPSGNMLAIRYANSNVINLWNSSKGERVGNLYADGTPADLAFSPDAATLAVVGTNSQVQIWDYRNNRLLQSLPGESVKAIAYLPGGRGLITCGDRNQIWQLSTGMVQQSFGALENCDAIALTADGTTLIAASDLQMQVWQLLLNEAGQAQKPVNHR